MRENSRKILLNLTEAGRTLHGAIVAIAKQRQRRLLAAIPKNAAAILVTSLTTLQEEADRMLEELDAASDRPAAKKPMPAAEARRKRPAGTRKRTKTVPRAPRSDRHSAR